MVDIASSHSIFSFMDGSSGYNQIYMDPLDEKNITFKTPIRVFYYKVMPFCLKNAGATYQWAMTKIFDELIHNQVECYVDDLVIKSIQKEDHLFDLRIIFERLRQYELKMNPLKCAFGVSSGKFLGFVVRHHGIEIDPLKIKAILEMPPPKSLTQLRSFQGRLAYLRRFISNLSGRCQPFAILNKKDSKYVWDDKCQTAFEEIKRYLANPPVLAAPIPGRPLILYTTALEESVGALLAQINEEGKENSLYYLSRRLLPTEIRYPMIERQCLALIFAAQKLRHYMLSHKINLISRINPLQYLVTRPTLSGHLARWSMVLLQFDITFIPLKAVKGQAVSNFLAAHPLPEHIPINDELPDEQVMSLVGEENSKWELYFDGAASFHKDVEHSQTIPGRAGIGLVFITPSKGTLRYSYHLSEPCTNNEAEYEALIIGLELAIMMEIKEIYIFGDSQLVINQISGVYKVLNPKLLKYHQYSLYLLELIPLVTLYKIPRGENTTADALAKLAKELSCLGEEKSISIEVQNHQTLSLIDMDFINQNQKSNKIFILAVGDEENDWRQPFIDYLSEGKLPDDKSVAYQIKKHALSYALINNTLYRRSYDQLWLRCLTRSEALKIVTEVHSGLCGAHQSGPKIKLKIKRLGYYWPAMLSDCMKVAKHCHQCQIHGVVLHQPPNVLHPMVSSWPFESWGTDIIGPIDPPSSKGHRFILAATDYFSKWAEAIPLRQVTSHHVIKFFRDNIVYHFGVPRRIISDNGMAFKSTKINNFAVRHHIDWRYSTIYYPRANGLAEAFNKTLVRIIKKSLEENKK
ncbi:reverse transcriptase-like protein [Klebsiella pneumoniae]|nr:reverse transcriptase-like protein [Klebsiella pneumoniae]